MTSKKSQNKPPRQLPIFHKGPQYVKLEDIGGESDDNEEDDVDSESDSDSDSVSDDSDSEDADQIIIPCLDGGGASCCDDDSDSGGGDGSDDSDSGDESDESEEGTDEESGGPGFTGWEVDYDAPLHWEDGAWQYVNSWYVQVKDGSQSYTQNGVTYTLSVVSSGAYYCLSPSPPASSVTVTFYATITIVNSARNNTTGQITSTTDYEEWSKSLAF